MNKTIESYIEPAMEAIGIYLKPNESEPKKLPKEFKGYISSLGASIIMSGLVPTIAFYASKENSAKANRGQILEWVFYILHKKANYAKWSDAQTIFKEIIKKSDADKMRIERDVLNASIALKLCIRTFESST